MNKDIVGAMDKYLAEVQKMSDKHHTGMKELLEFIGKEAAIQVNGLIVYVTVKDVKVSYGKTRYLVTPVAGKGDVWVENITFDKI